MALVDLRCMCLVSIKKLAAFIIDIFVTGYDLKNMESNYARAWNKQR